MMDLLPSGIVRHSYSCRGYKCMATLVVYEYPPRAVYMPDLCLTCLMVRFYKAQGNLQMSKRMRVADSFPVRPKGFRVVASSEAQ